jgi:hypothetical protein
MPVINPFLCDVNVESQDQCLLLNDTLPNELLDAIIKLDTPSPAESDPLGPHLQKAGYKSIPSLRPTIASCRCSSSSPSPRRLRLCHQTPQLSEVTPKVDELGERLETLHFVRQVKRFTGGGLEAGAED